VVEAETAHLEAQLAGHLSALAETVPGVGYVAAKPSPKSEVERIGDTDRVNIKKYVPPEISVGAVQHELKLDENRKAALTAMAINPKAKLIYVVRDEEGNVLKVGETKGSKIEVRFAKYYTARLYGNHEITVDILEVKLPAKVKLRTVEASVRGALLKDAESGITDAAERGRLLPWDNTDNRLGYLGQGTPGQYWRGREDQGWAWDLATGLLRVKATGEPVSPFFRTGGITADMVLPEPPRPPPSAKDLKQALIRNGGNVSAVARELGFHRQTITNYLEAAGIEPSDFSPPTKAAMKQSLSKHDGDVDKVAKELQLSKAKLMGYLKAAKIDPDDYVP
jgi:hypothetical protein